MKAVTLSRTTPSLSVTGVWANTVRTSQMPPGEAHTRGACKGVRGSGWGRGGTRRRQEARNQGSPNVQEEGQAGCVCLCGWVHPFHTVADPNLGAVQDEVLAVRAQHRSGTNTAPRMGGVGTVTSGRVHEGGRSCNNKSQQNPHDMADVGRRPTSKSIHTTPPPCHHHLPRDRNRSKHARAKTKRTGGVGRGRDAPARTCLRRTQSWAP
jgi:hypothetical protein